MKGYKVFNPDWTCRNYQYEVGQTYEMKQRPKICERGFHFCEKPVDCFNFYDFNPSNKVAEVEAIGDLDTDGTKTCTNKILILREISWDEVLTLVNVGKNCTGFCNTGNRNTGDWNTGDWNTGNRNTGDCNTGDWNNTNFSNGCFNTIESKILMFNKPSDWTYRDWLQSDARYLLNRITHKVVEWIDLDDMTDEEKILHPEAKTTGGYLKVLDESENAQIWWDSLNDDQKEVIKALPNFDAEIFEKCVGVKI